MKKKLMKKGLLLWVACFIFSMCFIPFEAKAATDSAPKVEKRIVRYRSTYVNDKQVYLENLENGKITSVKSSNRNNNDCYKRSQTCPVSEGRWEKCFFCK